MLWRPNSTPYREEELDSGRAVTFYFGQLTRCMLGLRLLESVLVSDNMSVTVCIAPSNTLEYPNGGGHLWAYLNWALGFRALGCKVIWLEFVRPSAPAEQVRANIAALKSRLETYGLVNCLALHSCTNEPLPPEETMASLSLEEATEADLLLELRSNTPAQVVKRFEKSAFVDLDPGLLQTWVNNNLVYIAPHDVYFTIGETVGHPETLAPDVGLTWNYTPPPVAIDSWAPCEIRDGRFTSVAHWYANGGLLDDPRLDDKRTAFMPFLDLPLITGRDFELALDLSPKDDQRFRLEEHGWRVVNAHVVASTPWDYQSYIQGSLAEFSCAKPSYVKLETAWISDRTLCYLASGKPALVQYTGRSGFLPDAAGLFRFRDLKEAAECVEQVLVDYEHQCKLARNFAEDYFDARKVAAKVLERALS